MSNWDDDRDAWAADWDHLHGIEDHKPLPLPMQHCDLHGDYQPRTILDGECAACLAATLAHGVRDRRPFYRNR